MSQTKRLALVLLLNMAMISGLILIGLSSHSLGMLAAGGDYAADSLAILFGLLAIYFRDHTPYRKTATSIVALINALLLLAVTSFVIAESFRRLFSHTPEINGGSVFVISLVAALVMGIGVVILTIGKQKDDLHMRSVLLDTVADASSAAAVAATGAVILFHPKLSWLDSGVALIIGIVIAIQAIMLLRDVIKALRKAGQDNAK